MNRTFCSSCGKATEYSLDKPRLCAFCGTPFAGITNVASKPPLLKRPPNRPPPPSVQTDYEEETDEEDDNLSAEEAVQSLSDIQVEVIHNKPTKTTIKDLAAGRPVDIKSLEKLRQKNPKVSQKKFLEEFSREAGAIKPQSFSRRNKSQD